MSDADFNNLKSDIDAHGLRQPIVTYNGMILDGGNRFKACQEIGLTPTLTEYEYDDIGAFVLSCNLHRRHMSVSQQAAIVASVANWAGAAQHGDNRYTLKSATNSTLENQVLQIALENQTALTDDEKEQSATNRRPQAQLQTIKDRAAQSGASPATQRKADAVAKADPELARAVGRGEVKLNEATRKVAPQLLNQATPAEYEYSETDRLRDDLAELQELCAAQQVQIATNIYDGDDVDLPTIVQALRDENKALIAEKNTIASQRDEYMKENAELKRMIKSLQKQLNK